LRNMGDPLVGSIRCRLGAVPDERLRLGRRQALLLRVLADLGQQVDGRRNASHGYGQESVQVSVGGYEEMRLAFAVDRCVLTVLTGY